MMAVANILRKMPGRIRRKVFAGKASIANPAVEAGEFVRYLPDIS